MFTRKDEWPEVGELIVATVNSITQHGVYTLLDEYEKEGFLHISEISSSWVRNIRDFIHEDEKVVLKVLRVNPEKKHIDLSLRRVTKSEKRNKMLIWKQSKKAESLLRSASQKIGISLEEIYKIVWMPIEEAYGEAYYGFEKAAREGVKTLSKIGIPNELATVLTEISKEKIKISSVKLKEIIEFTCPKSDGVLKIKNAFIEAGKLSTLRNENVRIYTISPPKYMIEVTARDYKKAKNIMVQFIETAVKNIVDAGGQGNFNRG